MFLLHGFFILLVSVSTLSQSETSDVRDNVIKLEARKDVRHQTGSELVSNWIKNRASESIEDGNDSEIDKPTPCGLYDPSNKRQGRCFSWLFNWYAKRKMTEMMDTQLSNLPYFGDGNKKENGASPDIPSQASSAVGPANDAMKQALMLQQKFNEMQPGSLAGGGGGGMPSFGNLPFDFRHLPMY